MFQNYAQQPLAALAATAKDIVSPAQTNKSTPSLLKLLST
jgi:hypothetical protein